MIREYRQTDFDGPREGDNNEVGNMVVESLRSLPRHVPHHSPGPDRRARGHDDGHGDDGGQEVDVDNNEEVHRSVVSPLILVLVHGGGDDNGVERRSGAIDTDPAFAPLHPLAG